MLQQFVNVLTLIKLSKKDRRILVAIIPNTGKKGLI